MKLIKLTSFCDVPIFFNIETISTFCGHKENMGSPINGSDVGVIGVEETWFVKESVEEIERMLNELQT